MSQELMTDTKPGLADLTAEMMRSYIGRTLVFQRPASADLVELDLLEVVSQDRIFAVESARPEGWKRHRVPFSLLFVLKDGFAPLGQGLHRLQHDAFEDGEWFLSRVFVPQRDQTKAYYEAVFA
jgi:Domain of unknown function (DUF6916)